MNHERNPIARFIMKGNPNPNNFILGCCFSLTLFYVFSVYVVDDIVRGMYLGFLFVVNVYHWTNIQDTKRNWNNKKYWKIIRFEHKNNIINY